MRNGNFNNKKFVGYTWFLRRAGLVAFVLGVLGMSDKVRAEGIGLINICSSYCRQLDKQWFEQEGRRLAVMW